MVTLDINDNELKIMDCTSGKITRWASLALDPGIFEDEVIVDIQAFSAALKQLMSSSGIRERQVVVGINSLFSLSRILTVATPINTPVTEQAVMEATEDVMPLTSEDLYFSWKAVASGEGGQQVLVVGVPRDVMDSEVMAVKQAGLDPKVLDLKTLALARAPHSRDAIILNIDSTSYDIVIVAEGIPELLRSTAWKPDDLSDEEKTENLSSALDITADFYNSQHPGDVLKRDCPLFITGQLSGDSSLVEALTKALRFKVEPLKPPLQYPPHFPVSQYAVNIGLAMKSVTGARFSLRHALGKQDLSAEDTAEAMRIPNMNILPSTFKPWRPTVRQVYYALAIIGAVVLLFPIYQVTNREIDVTNSLKLKYDVVNKLLLSRKTELSKRDPLQKTIDQYEAIVNIGGSTVDDFNTIESLAAANNVEVNSIVHTGSDIRFNAQADTFIDFRAFVNALEQSGRFLTPITPPEQYPNVTGGSINMKVAENK